MLVAPPAEPAEPDDAAIETALRDALLTMSVKQAAQSVADATGLSRRDLYQRALSIKSGS